METLPRQEMDKKVLVIDVGLHSPLDMVMRPEEKSWSYGEQCIEECGVVMEMALGETR